MKSGNKVNTDERILNSVKIPDNANLNDYALQQIAPNSLIIKNGVMYIVGGISSGKSTLLSKLALMYKNTINPIIISFYAGLSPDETTTFSLNAFKLKVNYVKLPTPESMVSFFNQFRYKRTKLAELLMFLLSIFKDDANSLLAAIGIVEDLSLQDSSMKYIDSNLNKRFKFLNSYVNDLIIANKINVNSSKQFIYLSEFILKTYAKKRKINFTSDPVIFISNCLISITKGFHEQTITVDILNEPGIKIKNVKRSNISQRFQPYTFDAFLRVANSKDVKTKKNKLKIELIPSITIFDDVAQYPLMTTEHSSQFIKDVFAETRRSMNTIIIAGQRYNLLNKTLRSLTHTFFFGYSIVDNDLPVMAKEIPSNLMDQKEFLLMYKQLVKPFSFLVYNNKYGINFIQLKK